MPVYNGGSFLIDAVASIVEQSFSDWELICVNDGSTDDSPNVLDWFATKDNRIQIVHQSNAGIVAALNRGCTAARGKLICRMDCDDIALEDRLRTQYGFLVEHPDCVVVGSAILAIDTDSSPLGVQKLPSEHEQIRANLMHRNTGHFHPTTMIRAAALKSVGGYRKQYQWIEDHDLWIRLSRQHRLANLDSVQLCYRQHASSVCWQQSSLQRELMNDLLVEAYGELDLAVPEYLLLSKSSNRSAANPGKWARAAVKGGYPRSAIKHLRRLMTANASLSYKLRMAVETFVRLPMSMLKSGLLEECVVDIPSFERWHEAYAQTTSQAAA